MEYVKVKLDKKVKLEQYLEKISSWWNFISFNR